jgi:lysophospholipase L1-like esterase
VTASTNSVTGGITINVGTTPTGNTIVLFGDSIVNNNNTNNGLSGASNVTDQAQTRDYGFFTMANIAMGGPFIVLRNSGRAGDTTGPGVGSLGNMLSRIQTDVVAYQPEWCLVEGGINDINLGYTAQSIIDNLKSIYSTLMSSGIKVIACPILPNNVLNALGAGNSKVEALATVNAWILKYCSAIPGVFVVDTFSAIYDTATVCGAVSGTLADSTHPSPVGASLIGSAVSASLSKFFKPNPVLVFSGDIASATLPTGNLVPYAVLAGTAGTYPSANVTSSPGSGGIPTGWWLQDSNTIAAGSSATYSRVARTDKPNKTWWQTVLAWTATQSSVATYQFRLLAGAALPAGVVAGDIVDTAIELNYLSQTNTGALEVFVEARNSSNTTLTTSSHLYSIGPTTPSPSFSGVIRLRNFTIPATTTNLMVKIITRNLAGTIGGVTVQIGEIEIRKRSSI